MNNKEVLETAVKGFKWLEEHPEAWKWEDGHKVLLTEDVPVFVKETIARNNRGVDKMKRIDALQDKLEGNN